MLQSMGSQRVGRDLVTEQQQSFRSPSMSPHHYTKNIQREVWLKRPRCKETSDIEETT